ncbi:T9SS type A sorting domain-containing protein [Owenweeksia hongkongensis]|uniref:T9SS type A sorting domain-containing protein n=1 Tax=Owenweeksia hongkongensis TaxID=253245 RepID=UPI003A8D830A
MKCKFSHSLVVLIFIFGINLSAQYQPTITDSKEWLVKTCEFGNCLHDYYYFVADTAIGGNSYKVLDGFHYNKNFYLREDVFQRQVFLLIDDGSLFLQEYLLYDYGMNVGDSLYLRNPISPVSAVEGYYHLDSINLETFEQITRNVFYLHGWDTQKNYHETKWIEGIGSTGLINTPGVIGDTTAMAELLCVSENVRKIYSRKPNDTCYSNPVLEIEEALQSDRPTFYYAQESRVLRFQNLSGSAVLSVFDINGKAVYEEEVSSETEALSLEKLKHGIYMVSLRAEESVEVKKILVN